MGKKVNLKNNRPPVRALLILFLLAGAFVRVHGQGSGRDSLQVFALIQKADQYFNRSSWDTALLYTAKAVSAGVESKYPFGEAYALIKQTDILIAKGDYQKAAAFPLREESLGERLKDSTILAVSYLHMAQLKMYENEPGSAIPLFVKAFRTRLGSVTSQYSALACNDLGYTYGLLSDYTKQAEQLIKALQLYEQLQDDDGAAMALSNLASMYYEMGDKDKAIEYQLRSIAKRKETDVEGMSVCYCNICQMYMQQGNLKEAERYQQLCSKFSQQSRVETKVIMGYITAGLLANAKGDNKTSYETEKKVIAILENSHGNDIMLATRYLAAAIAGGNVRDDSLKVLSWFSKAKEMAVRLNLRENIKSVYYYQTIFYKDRKNYYEAYENFKKYISYRDSLNSEGTKKTIAELETKYQSEKKDNEIQQLNTEKKIKQLEIEKQKAIITGNRLQAAKKQNEIDLLAKSRELLDTRVRQQDAELEKNLLVARNSDQALKLARQEKELRDRQLESQKFIRNLLVAGVLLLALLSWVFFNRYQLKKKLEQQQMLLSIRNNIAKDLHDEIGSTLTSIKILSEVSQSNIRKDKEKAALLLGKITEQSAHMQQGMSDIIWAIKPDNDKLENMVVRMREYVSHTLESRDINIIFSVDERAVQESIGMEQRRDFLLIFKEAVNNIAKYAACHQVRIGLNHTPGAIRLQIEDDGVGFDPDLKTSSSGLKNMHVRAAALKGTLKIVSSPGKGTCVILDIPAT